MPKTNSQNTYANLAKNNLEKKQQKQQKRTA